MVVRTISSGKYVLAGLITLLVFSLGMSLGIIIDNARLKTLQYQTEKQEIDFESLQFQYLYLTSLEEEGESCSALQATLDKSVAELGKTLDTFVSYKMDSKINKKSYMLIGRKYLLDNLQYWFFARKSKQRCNSDVVSILYFYSSERCPACSDQGVLLTYFKKLYGEQLLVFPIDVDFEEEEPLIGVMKSRYGINDYPALVIENLKYPGIRYKEELAGLICSSFKNESSCIKEQD